MVDTLRPDRIQFNIQCSSREDRFHHIEKHDNINDSLVSSSDDEDTFTTPDVSPTLPILKSSFEKPAPLNLTIETNSRGTSMRPSRDSFSYTCKVGDFFDIEYKIVHRSGIFAPYVLDYLIHPFP
jgi:hypothetical protein